MFDPDPNRDPSKPSATRIGIWVAVAGVGLYFLVSGVIGIVSGRGG